MKSKINKFICFANEKKAVELSFNWIFAIIAGVIILLLALYGVSKIVKTSESLSSAESASALSALLDPLETGLASGKSQEISLNREIKIFYTCTYLDNKPFGKQTISLSEKNLKNEFGEKGEEISIKNKYIFTEDNDEGKKFYVFAKPFFIGFKVADMIVISSKEYCFYQPPNEIKTEIENLNIGKIKVSEDLKNCTGIKVCFDSGRAECDIKVYGTGIGYEYGKVVKNNKEVYYKNSLIYSAIFSSPEIYECNVKRLMNRLNELTGIYYDKTDIIQKKGCDSSIKTELEILRNSAKSINSSKDLIILSDNGDKIDLINRALLQGCKLY